MVERGYSFYDLYTMTVYLRGLFIRIAIKKQEKERKDMDKSRGVSEGASTSKKSPGTVPGFVARQSSAK